jgi:hypothetical protein
MPRGPFIGLERGGEFLLDARAKNLDRDVAAFDVTARWTWAIEAAPTGISSTCEKRLSIGASSACSMAFRIAG